MAFMVNESVWNSAAAAIVQWRKDYDQTYRKVFKAEPRQPGMEHPVYRDLYAASELILNPPREKSAREEASLAGVKALYATGPSYQRVMGEIRKGRFTTAAHFIELDLNSQNLGVPYVVDPQSLRATDRGVEYIATAVRPPMPQTPEEAALFFMRYGNFGADSDPRELLGDPARARRIRSSVLLAVNAGHFPQANQAALLLAQHYGLEPQDVSPYPDNSTSPWVDALPVEDPRLSGTVSDASFRTAAERQVPVESEVADAR